jgi:hypothetical protein
MRIWKIKDEWFGEQVIRDIQVSHLCGSTGIKLFTIDGNEIIIRRDELEKMREALIKYDVKNKEELQR